MNPQIYQSEPQGCCINESPQNDMENKFISAVCEIVCDAIAVNYSDKRIVLPLLKNVIKEKLDNNYPKDNLGLLQQYQKYILDKSSESIIKELNLGDVKVNHGHATHAKFNDIIQKIKEFYVISTKNHGTI